MKSVWRVPIPITRSARRARSSAVAVPVWPMPPTSAGWSWRSEPLPAWVEATGIRVAAANAARVSSAALWWTPPPATIRGRRAARTARTARSSSYGSGAGLRTCQTRSAKNSAGQSYASACTSCGRASVTAPVSAGSVSVRTAWSAAGISASGRVIRSK